MPKEKKTEHKTESIKLMLTPLEKVALREKANLAGMTMSQLLLDSVDGNDIINPDIAAQLSKVKNEVNRIGVNLNQLTKLANIYGSQIEIQDLIDTIDEYRQENSLLYKTVSSWVRDAD